MASSVNKHRQRSSSSNNHNNNKKRETENPSFSSTLLDSIYNSIEEEKEASEKRVLSEKIVVGVDFAKKHSSDTMQRPRPIRTSLSSSLVDEFDAYIYQKPKREGGFGRTKSKALKLYSDLKKVKHLPVSPGGRLAGFLNTLFANAKKSRTSSFEQSSKSGQSSTCSSASLFSRSCMSKTPSSRRSSSDGTKRSVRFYPDCKPCGYDKSVHGDKEVNSISVTHLNSSVNGEILKKYRQNRNDNVCLNSSVNEEILNKYRQNRNDVVCLNSSINEEILKKYSQNQNDSTVCFESRFDFDDDDDDASCSSSDLFELDNLSVIGIERYNEELPVYGTTRIRNYN